MKRGAIQAVLTLDIAHGRQDTQLLALRKFLAMRYIRVHLWVGGCVRGCVGVCMCLCVCASLGVHIHTSMIHT